MKKSIVAVVSACALAAACGGPAGEARKAQTSLQPAPPAGTMPIAVETLAEGLQNPWSIAFLPQGDLLVSERPGRLRVIRDGWRDGEGLVAPRLVDAPVEGVPAPFVKSQAGLFDVALSPDYANDRTLYFAYAEGDAGANQTALAAAQFDGAALSGLRVIYRTPRPKRAGAHYGGRIAFMPDGALLLTVGDGFDWREEAQSLQSGLGKIVRLRTDGTAPDDNPFAATPDALAQIWTRGHRNPQGLAVDPQSGVVAASEHGPKGGDEINIILPGANYGWPIATYGLDYSGAQVAPFTAAAGTVAPLLYWTPSIAPSGLAFYRGSMFAEWDGDLLSGALSGADPTRQGLRRIDLEGGRVVGEETYLQGERVRDVRVGPDGAIYVATEDHDGAAVGKILRLAPAAE